MTKLYNKIAQTKNEAEKRAAIAYCDSYIDKGYVPVLTIFAIDPKPGEGTYLARAKVNDAKLFLHRGAFDSIEVERWGIPQVERWGIPLFAGYKKELIRMGLGEVEVEYSMPDSIRPKFKDDHEDVVYIWVARLQYLPGDQRELDRLYGLLSAQTLRARREVLLVINRHNGNMREAGLSLGLRIEETIQELGLSSPSEALRQVWINEYYPGEEE